MQVRTKLSDVGCGIGDTNAGIGVVVVGDEDGDEERVIGRGCSAYSRE
jgi:hypothetical protein